MWQTYGSSFRLEEEEAIRNLETIVLQRYTTSQDRFALSGRGILFDALRQAPEISDMSALNLSQKCATILVLALG